MRRVFVLGLALAGCSPLLTNPADPCLVASRAFLAYNAAFDATLDRIGPMSPSQQNIVLDDVIPHLYRMQERVIELAQLCEEDAG